jgi:hypothetical protein
MPKRRARIAPLVVLMLVAAQCTLVDYVHEYVREQMKQKRSPGAVLSSSRTVRYSNNNPMGWRTPS